MREILSVTVYGSEGEASVIDPDTLSWPIRCRGRRGCISSERPEPLRDANGIEIDFSAGFGEAGTDVPDLLKRAVTLLVAHWYEFRTAFGPGDQPVSYPAGYDRMLSSYRDRRL